MMLHLVQQKEGSYHPKGDQEKDQVRFRRWTPQGDDEVRHYEGH